jgi:hypothetical protein
MEVHHPARLKLRDLHILDPHQPPDFGSRHAAERGKTVIQRVGRALPQLRGQGVEQHMLCVVIAVRTQRRADRLVPRLMPRSAEQRLAMRTHPPSPPRTAPVTRIILRANAVHRTERGSGQRDKHQRIVRHRLRNALAAGHPAARHLIRIAPIQPRARSAPRRTPVAAPDRHRPERRISAGELIHHRARSQSDRQRPPAQPDRTLTRPDIPNRPLRPPVISSTTRKRLDPRELLINLRIDRRIRERRGGGGRDSP